MGASLEDMKGAANQSRGGHGARRHPFQVRRLTAGLRMAPGGTA